MRGKCSGTPICGSESETGWSSTYGHSQRNLSLENGTTVGHLERHCCFVVADQRVGVTQRLQISRARLRDTLVSVPSPA
ncbi:hypothetical protein D3C81_1696620 [compost metagenome]